MTIGITGMAMKSSLGDTLDECYKAMCKIKDGNAQLRSFDTEKYNAKHSYEIDDRENGEDRPYRASDWLTDVVKEAARNSQVDFTDKRCGVFVGTGLRELRSVELWHTQNKSIELDRLHFGSACNQGLNVKVPVYTFCNACSASNFTLGIAMDMLEDDSLDVAIVCGIDSITESMFGLLDRVNPMNPQFLRSLNKDRRGVVMGEGAAAVVLEKSPTKASITLRGVGMSCDAYQDTAPHKDGLVAAMQDAGKRSGVTPNEIDMLLVHGTGTILNDEVEMQAVREYFGDNLGNLNITGLKPNIGHTSGASGLISTIIASKSLIEGSAPPIFGLHDPIEMTEGMQLLSEPGSTDAVKNVQINAFGFGGVNAVVIVSRS